MENHFSQPYIDIIASLFIVIWLPERPYHQRKVYSVDRSRATVCNHTRCNGQDFHSWVSHLDSPRHVSRLLLTVHISLVQNSSMNLSVHSCIFQQVNILPLMPRWKVAQNPYSCLYWSSCKSICTPAASSLRFTDGPGNRLSCVHSEVVSQQLY